MALSTLSSSTDTGAAATAHQAAVATTAGTTVGKADNATVASAVDLSSESGIVATLGANYTGIGTYNAVGLLNSIAEAGQASATATTPAATDDAATDEAQASAASDAALIGSLATADDDTATAAGVYSATGTLQNLSATTAASYNALIKANPGIAATFVGDSYDGGIVDTFA